MRYIDAECLKDKTTRVNNIWNVTTNAEGKGLDEIIDDIPTADVRENVWGEWIDCGIHGDWAWEQDGHGNFWHIWKCSKCEHTTEHRSNYCPNCGADMRGDNNG